MNTYQNSVQKKHAALLVAFSLIMLVVLFWTTTSVQAQSDNTYAVVINQVKSGMGDSCGGPEFYARFYNPRLNKWINSSSYGGRDFSPPRRSSKKFSRTHGKPNDWGMWDYVNENGGRRVVIRLMESDTTFCGGGDDHVDISSGAGKDLWIWIARSGGQRKVYHAGTWRVCPLVNYPRSSHHICHITSSGNGGESATVKLSIEFPPFP